MLIDIVAAVLLCFAVFKGYTKGLIVGVFSFLAFVIGLAAALKLSSYVAASLQSSTNISQRWAPFIAFSLVFIGVALLVRLGARALEGAVKMVMLGWINRLGGILFFALLYLFLYSVLLFYVEKLGLIKPVTVAASVSYPVIHPLGPKVIDAIGVLLPIFKNVFLELEGFFGKLPPG